MSQQVDIYYDPDTGEMTVKIDGLPDQQCLDLTKFLKGTLGMTDAKVTQTHIKYEGDGATGGESIHRGWDAHPIGDTNRIAILARVQHKLLRYGKSNLISCPRINFRELEQNK